MKKSFWLIVYHTAAELSIVLLICLSLFFNSSNNIVWGEAEGKLTADLIEEALKSGKSSKKETKLKGYGAYRGRLIEWCKQLENDGRRELLYLSLVGKDVKDPECLACKMFFKSVILACKPKDGARKIKKKTDHEHAHAHSGDEGELSTPEPTSKVVFKQREPTVATVKVAVELFSALSEDKNASYHLQALKRLQVLIYERCHSPAEKEYFSTLWEYIYGPFKVLDLELTEKKRRIEERGGKASKQEKAVKQKEDVNEMF